MENKFKIVSASGTTSYNYKNTTNYKSTAINMSPYDSSHDIDYNKTPEEIHQEVMEWAKENPGKLKPGMPSTIKLKINGVIPSKTEKSNELIKTGSEMISLVGSVIKGLTNSLVLAGTAVIASLSKITSLAPQKKTLEIPNFEENSSIVEIDKKIEQKNKVY